LIGINDRAACACEDGALEKETVMVIRSVLAALLLGSCALIAVPAEPLAPASQTAAPGSVERGQTFVQTHCSSCHAVGDEGPSPLAAAPPLREISRRYPVEQLGEAFAEGFVTTHPTMPEFVLDPGQNRDLIAYLASIQVK
jgi:cytochrome c